jgi:hypothetical protein
MASQLIHYELPWNPNRLEQRNGRIDRYGQQVPLVYIWTLVMRDTLDAKILKVLVEKAQRIREDFGFSPPFFGDDTNVIDIIKEQGLVLTQSQRTLFDFAEASEQPPLNPFDEAVLERIQSESFYGQSDIELSEVRDRLKATEAVMGSKEQFEHFILNGLKTLGCRVDHNNDVYETIKITLSDTMAMPGVSSVIERATFDPKKALQSTGIVQLNAGHPVVRRVIDLVRQSIFEGSEIGYGRTTAITTSEVSHIVLLYHFLVRFSVGGTPATIIEELVPVACDLAGTRALSTEEIDRLTKAQPSPSTRTPEEITQQLAKAIEPETYAKARDSGFAERLMQIKAERRTLKEKLIREEPQEWLEGIDRVSRASSDLLSIAVYYPAHPGGRA